ncbi:MAG: hypothetical protein ACLUKN_13710 [Bacilli bacterium]
MKISTGKTMNLHYSTPPRRTARPIHYTWPKKTYDFSAANIFRKYGEQWRSKYADIAHKRLRSWGLNTIANSSDKFIYSQNKTPFIERLETRGPSFSFKRLVAVCDPFDPEFRSYLRAQLEKGKASL